MLEFLRYRKFCLLLALVVLFIIPVDVGAATVVSIAVPVQSVAQGSQATFLMTVTGTAPPPQTYQMMVSGATGTFSPNPVTWNNPPNPDPTTNFVVDTPYCPGTYSFTVTAQNTAVPGDFGTAIGSFTVTPAGPPLQVTVSTNSPAYKKGDTITISVSANRPAEGVLQVTPPSGAAQTYSFAFTGATYGAIKTLTASAPYGTWVASVQADDYCSVASSASANFAVGPDTYDASFSLSGVPSQVSAGLLIDGQHGGNIGGSENKKLSFTIGTSHTIAIDQYISGGTGVRYYCAENTWSPSAADTHTFGYETQYQFMVDTDPSGITSVTGGGWFPAGASAQTNQVPQTLPGPSGTQYVFKNWIVDGVAQTGNQVSMNMNQPHSAIAKYATQYQLVVDSPGGLGNPQGSGYYDAGSTATFFVSSPVGFLVQQVFVRWEGDYTGSSPQGSVAMDGSKAVHAVWEASYTELYIIAGAVAAVIVVGAVLMMRRRKGPPSGAKKEEPGEKRELSTGKPEEDDSSAA